MMKIKYYFWAPLIIMQQAFAQDPGNWQHLDPVSDSIPGISTKKAYEYLEGRKADTVVVAIIDNGADVLHEDLQGRIWRNPGEITGNHSDDDGNGYVDDIFGWNYLGNSDGRNFKNETLEMTRLVAYYHQMFNGTDSSAIPASQAAQYQKYLEVRTAYESEVSEKLQEIAMYANLLANYQHSDSVISRKLRKSTFDEEEVEKIRSRRKVIVEAREFLLRFYAFGIDTSTLRNRINNLTGDLDTRLNTSLRIREEVIGDDTGNMADSLYGNSQVDALGPSHGTAVAGAIAALQNGTGIDGVARTVKIMVLRAVPDGDERDKDIALAIRYAVQHGADIINCSFGKQYSAYPEFVARAVEYAEQKDVLIVHAAGNDGVNTDSITYYPTGLRPDGIRAANWITVGATTPFNRERLVAPFSNYGSSTVDIFAPGYQVRTCTLNDGYAFVSGTSISSPIVSGVAAVLKSYFPHLTAPEIREIIIRSAYKPEAKEVIRPGQEGDSLTEFSRLSVAGGIVNLYQAVTLADSEYGHDIGPISDEEDTAKKAPETAVKNSSENAQ